LAAELITLERWWPGRIETEEIPGIQSIVAQKLEALAMKIICARARGYIYDRA